MMAQRGMVARGAVRSARVGRCGGPIGADGREVVGVRALLEWAFAVECAQLDYDCGDVFAGERRPGVGMEARIAEQLAMGKQSKRGVRVDTSIGRTLPPDDAELVATTVRHVLPWSQAVMVADHARSGCAPVWDLGPQRVVPREWKRANQHGQQPQERVVYVERVLSKRGRLIGRNHTEVPVMIVPSSAQIAAARRRYLDWWGGLLAVLAGLRAVKLDWFSLSGDMPPMTPWRKGLD